MARVHFACFLFLIITVEISAVKSQDSQANWKRNIHELPYWIQDSLLDYGDEIGERNITGPIRKIYRKDLDPNYVAYYEFQFKDEFLIFSAGPKTGDHRLVEEGNVPRITDILIEQAAKINKVCQKFFRLNADGTTICEDETRKPVASTMDLRTLTKEVNMATLANDVGESLNDFRKQWKELAIEIRDSLEWKEISISRRKENPSGNKSATIFKVLTLGDSEAIPIGNSDVSKVKIETRLHSSKKMMATLCTLLGHICTKEGKLKFSSILHKKKNLENLNYIEIDVNEDYESLMKPLKDKSIHFYLQLTVAEKYVVIRRYTLSLSRPKSKRSSWSGFTQYSIPYEDLMPDYDQHKCCGGCYSGCTPVAWAQIFAYYDRVAHEHGYRYSTNHWRGLNGAFGDPSNKAPGKLNDQVKKYVEALRSPLRTYCNGDSGSTLLRNVDKVDGWFRERQGSGRVITLSMSNIKYYVSHYVKKNYPINNSIWWLSTDDKGKKKKGGHSVVVTKIKERSRRYQICRKVGWWWGRKTKCSWKTEYEYEWYRRMGWGGYKNGWYPASARGAQVAIV